MSQIPLAGRLRPSFLLALALAAALPLAGCDEEIVPPDALDAYYTLWGALDPSSDRQAIRVIPVLREPALDDGAPLDATVTSRDLQSGEVVTWRDSVVTFADGTLGHVFVADFQARYATSYRVTVQRGDGPETAANVRVPALVLPYRQATEISLDGVFMPVLWQGAPQLNNIKLTYRLQDAACVEFDHTIDFAGEAEPFEFGWTTTVDLRSDAERVLGAYGNRQHAVLRMTLEAEVASDDWRPPQGIFDPELLIEPGTFSNVERGFGFVGGAYVRSFDWVPEPNALTRAGFQVPGFCG